MSALAELFLGRVSPQSLPSDEQVKQDGLRAINAYRTRHHRLPLAELPQGRRGMGYDHCVLGRCASDMPDQWDHGWAMSEIPAIRQLEIRFERHQLPELEGPRRPLRYSDPHEHPLAR